MSVAKATTPSRPDCTSPLCALEGWRVALGKPRLAAGWWWCLPRSWHSLSGLDADGELPCGQTHFALIGGRGLRSVRRAPSRAAYSRPGGRTAQGCCGGGGCIVRWAGREYGWGHCHRHRRRLTQRAMAFMRIEKQGMLETDRRGPAAQRARGRRAGPGTAAPAPRAAGGRRDRARSPCTVQDISAHSPAGRGCGTYVQRDPRSRAKRAPSAGQENDSDFGQDVALSADGDRGGRRALPWTSAAVVYRARRVRASSPSRPCSRRPAGLGTNPASAQTSAALRSGTTGIRSCSVDPERTSHRGRGVFTRSGSTWSGRKMLAEQLDQNRYLDAARTRRASVAISGNAKTALIGGPSDGNGVGAAWVFRRSGGAYSQQGSKLTASGGVGAANFGASVALSSDGSTALIGAPPTTTRSAHMDFERAGRGFAQIGGKLPNNDETADLEIGNTPTPGSGWEEPALRQKGKRARPSAEAGKRLGTRQRRIRSAPAADLAVPAKQSERANSA